MTISGSVVQSRNPLPVSPLRIDGVSLDTGIIVNAEINHAANMHSSATVTLTMADVNLDRFTGKPVYFRYGTNPNYGFFWGFIKAVSKDQKFQEQVQVTFTCYGFTWSLRTSTNKLWVNTTSEVIAQAIAGRHSLGLNFESHWFSHSRFSQIGSTDWEVLKDLGFMTGRCLVGIDGVLKFVDPLLALERRKAFDKFEKSVHILEPNDRSLLDFTPNTAVQATEDQLHPKFSYLSANGTLRTVDPPEQDETNKFSMTEAYVPNEDYARLISEVAAKRNSLNESASARVRGSGRLVPGIVVNMVTGLPTVATDSLDGLWFVTKVTHRIDTSVFQTGLELVRDKYRSPINQRYEMFDTPTSPSMKLVGTNWISSWR